MNANSTLRRNNLLEEHVISAGLGRILEKVLQEDPLTREDGLSLYATKDLTLLGYLATLVRESKHGDLTYFVRDHHLNPTNICRYACAFCAFRRSEGQDGAYEMSLQEIERRAHRIRAQGIREVHLVGGVHPKWSYDHYLEIVRTLHRWLPQVAIKGWTAVEVDHMTQISGHDTRRVLQDLKEAGIAHLAGGGAEVFAPEVRRRLCASKADADRWCEIHRAAHSLGIPSNATMLYGHIEEPCHKVDHLITLRDLQAGSLREFGVGFHTFIPLAFHPDNTPLAHLKRSGTLDHLRELAISRLMLDNVLHIKAYWVMIGVETAQLGLDFGADDLGGTVIEERITHEAGAETAQALTSNEITDLIREAGRIPRERTPAPRPIGSALEAIG